MSWQPPQTLDPTKVKVVITTRWAGTSYKSRTIRKVESFSIASHLDSDADPWTIEIGNIDAELNAALARDNEVRVQVFGAGTKISFPILLGLMDDCDYTEQGTMSLTGRDMSAIAMDSDHYPMIYRDLSPTKIIEQEARDLGMANAFKIRPIRGGPKRQETDGSEKYWEFWYRMVRKDGRWIWMTADGTLWSDDLNYNTAPKYRFVSQSIAKQSDIPVQNFSYHKTTQGRAYQFGIEWREQTVSQNKPTVTIVTDTTLKDWRKQPNKWIQDKHAVSQKTAKKVGNQEIFESRVGAVEIQVTVADPGYLIRQNNIAHVELPEYGIKGNWFVVGSVIRGGPDGFLQDVRLRENNFALTERVPDTPTWTKDPTNTAGAGGALPSGAAASALFGQTGEHGAEWWDCYVNAARKWHANYDLNLFLATLLAITDHETTFRNIRSNDCNDGHGNTYSAPGRHGVEWTDPAGLTGNALDEWRTTFANTGGDGYIRPGYGNAVGPMQIFDKGLKEQADTLKGGKVNEFTGDRWVPCSSIMVAAHHLSELSPGKTQADLWAGVCRYGGYSAGCSYGQEIANAVLNDPGWLKLVEDAMNSQVPPGTAPPPKDSGADKFAKRLQIYHTQRKYFDDNGLQMAQINAIANGQSLHNKCGNDVYVDAKVVGAMCYLIENDIWIGSYAICSDHDCRTDSGNLSRHPQGFAVDIDSVGGPGLGMYFINTPNPTCKRIVIKAMDLLADGGWLKPNQLICNGNGKNDPEVQAHQLDDGKPRGGIWVDDHLTHFHVGY